MEKPAVEYDFLVYLQKYCEQSGSRLRANIPLNHPNEQVRRVPHSSHEAAMNGVPRSCGGSDTEAKMCQHLALSEAGYRECSAVEVLGYPSSLQR